MIRWTRRLESLTPLLLVLGLAATAGEIEDFMVSGLEATLIRPHALSIHNSAEQKITISVSTDDGQPVDYTLREGEVREFTDGRSNRYIVRIPTGTSGEVKYRLESQKRYQIYWNQSRKLWDVVELAVGG